MSVIRVAIAVDDEALERLEQIARACRTVGFRAHSTLTGVGIFTGFVEAASVAALLAIPGVAAVEVERATRIHRP